MSKKKVQCLNCGAKVAKGMGFCGKCGEPLDPKQAEENKAGMPPEQDKGIASVLKYLLENKIVLIIIIAAVIVVVLIVILFQQNNARERGDAGTTTADNIYDTAGSFYYSDGIDENGFWENITALDYIEIFNYQALLIPKEVHQISDDEVQYVIDNILDGYSVEKQITDRPVADGDTVNIDYVGSIDGVEFLGGSTEGGGTEVTIGVTVYIDDFLEQLIGHMPGETIDVEVTFPEEYQDTSLQNKDALFVTTINYIIENELPVLTNDFVETNLYSDFGWKTVAEMEDSIQAQLQNIAVQDYINEYLTTEVIVLSVPDQLVIYQERAMLYDYQRNAEYYGMELEVFLSIYANISSVDELIELGKDNNIQLAIYSLVIQAIAEDMGLLVSEEDLINYFSDYIDINDYQLYVEEFGLPFLKQVVIHDRVIDYIFENAVLA